MTLAKLPYWCSISPKSPFQVLLSFASFHLLLLPTTSVLWTKELSLDIFQCLDILFGLPCAVFLLLLSASISPSSATNLTNTCMLIYSSSSVSVLFGYAKSCCCHIVFNSRKCGRRPACLRHITKKRNLKIYSSRTTAVQKAISSLVC